MAALAQVKTAIADKHTDVAAKLDAANKQIADLQAQLAASITAAQMDELLAAIQAI